MNETLPRVSILIAARPGQTEVLAVNAARQLDYPADLLEIMVARGRQPSVQRNAAVRSAQGEWIYFLDDDSVPASGNLRHAAKLFRDSKVQMVGGPNLCPENSPALEKLFAVVKASWLAFGPSRARYASLGDVRETTEKELILCNLLVRRQAMLDAGGFNEALYPNEENALMDELLKRGGKLYYDPQLIVHRRPRRSFGSFIKMLMTYGRGRAEQFRVHPTPGSALNFVPPLFVIYLLALPGLLLWVPSRFNAFGMPDALLPLCLYGLALVGQAGASAAAHGFARGLAAVPLVFLSHLFYGLGFWRGLFTRLERSRPPGSVDVKLETIPVS